MLTLRSFVLIVACTTTAAAIAADELPRRKSGLWDISVPMSRTSPPMTMQQCVDEETVDITVVMSQPNNQVCKNRKSHIKRDGGRIVLESTCQLKDMTVTTRGVFAGDFNSSYTHESTTTYSPPIAATKDGTTKATAQWTGPCKAGMKPGDVVMSNGVKFNVNDYKSAQKK